MNLLPHHLAHLRGSGLSDETIAAAGIYSLTDPLEAGRLLHWDGPGPAPTIAFPYFDIGGTEIGTVLRPDNPRLGEHGKPVKYEWAKGVPTRLYFPPSPGWPVEAWQDARQPLLLTEGIKKIWAAIQAGVHGISAQGTWVWHDVEHHDHSGKWRLHADFVGVPQRGRAFFIAFDGGDTTSNPPVVMAEARLARMLLDAGADVRLLRIPSEDGRKVGLDDYLVQQQDPRAALAALLLAAIPADPIARSRQAVAAEDRDGAVQRLVADLSFVASLHAAPVAVFDGAAASLKRGGISKTALKEAIVSYVNRFKPSDHPSTDHPASIKAKADEPDHPYRVIEGRLCRLQKNAATGGIDVFPIADFAAQIEEDVQYDDGAELSRVFLIGGTLSDGTTLAMARVASTEFAAMGWVAREWGARAAIHAGAAARDQVRDALQRLSKPVFRRVYRHSGWRQIDGTWIYLFHGGSVGGNAASVELDPPLDRLALPPTAIDARKAVAWSLSFLRCGEATITVPILAATYLAPVAFLLRPDIALWLMGATGQLKSELAAISQAHFGAFDRKTLPGSWSSTDNALEGRLFVVKDAVCVVDDYAPSTDLRAQKELERRAERVLRSIGNHSSRGRLRADLSQRPDRPPRGILVSTGEDRPPGASILARVMVVEVDRKKLNLSHLSELQKHTERLPHAMRAFIEWLRPQIADLSKSLPEDHRRARALFESDTAHLRQAEALAYLYIGIDLALRFAQEMSAVDAGDADSVRVLAHDALFQIGVRQQHTQREVSPAERFMTVLRDLLLQGRVRLAERDQPLGEAAQGDHAHARCEAIGWRDGENGYLLPEVTKRCVVVFLRDLNEHFPHTQQALNKALLAAKYVLPGADGRADQKVHVGGARPRVLKIPLGLLSESEAGPKGPSPAQATDEVGADPCGAISDENGAEVIPLAPKAQTSEEKRTKHDRKIL